VKINVEVMTSIEGTGTPVWFWPRTPYTIVKINVEATKSIEGTLVVLAADATHGDCRGEC